MTQPIPKRLISQWASEQTLGYEENGERMVRAFLIWAEKKGFTLKLAKGE